MTNLPFSGKFKITCEFNKKGDWIAGRHTGVDLVGIDSSKVYNTCDGIVEKVGSDSKYGNYVVVKSIPNNGFSGGYYHWFCHLKSINVKQGDKLSRVSTIGIMGSTR